MTGPKILDYIHKLNKRGWLVEFEPDTERDHVKWTIRYAKLSDNNEKVIARRRAVMGELIEDATIPEEQILLNEMKLLERQFENMLLERQKNIMDGKGRGHGMKGEWKDEQVGD